MPAAELRDEVIGLARALIRIDTSNPPGNETPAAELIAAHLRDAGVESELIGPDPERLNLVARIEGRGDGPSVMLMAHTDVVPAPIEGWTVGPFDGAVRDGMLIGRGATDMKNELAARVTAFAAFARSGERPAGDIVLVAESDEERNDADVGMTWLVRERPDLRCDFAINEGSSVLLELADGRRVVTVSVGEKNVTSIRVRVFGRAGHASISTGTDNSVANAAVAVERLFAARASTVIIPTMARALSALGARSRDPEEAVAEAASQSPLLTDWVPAMTRLTVVPTGLRTYEPPNVVPPFADVICDCRALPGQGEPEIRDHVAAALGNGFEHEIELLEPLAGGTESPIETDLYRVLEEWVAERLPGAALVPMIDAGFTDSHWVRGAFGTVAYGFAPALETGAAAYLEAAHGADEAIALADLVEMAAFHLHALRALSG